MKGISRFFRSMVMVVLVAALCIPFMPVAHAATGLARADNPRLFDALAAYLTPVEPSFIGSTQLAGLTGSLDLGGKSLRSCAGLEYCTGISVLDLSDNSISDLDPISHLDNLTGLNLSGNNLMYIDQLSTLTNIQTLNIAENRITHLDPGISNMANLHTLVCSQNRIASLRPIYDKPVTHLEVTWNFLNPHPAGAYDFYDVVAHLGLIFDTANFIDEGQITFSIAYDPDWYGTPSREADTGVYYGDTITLPTITVTDSRYVFLGWWINNATGDIRTGDVTFTPYDYIGGYDGIYSATIKAIYDTPVSHGKLARLEGDVAGVAPVFYPLRYGYTMVIPEDYPQVLVSARACFPEDNIKINGRSRQDYLVTIAHPGQHKDLTIKVTSAVNRRDYKIYHLRVTRARSTNAFLSNIRVTPYFSTSLIPGFDPWELDQTVYTRYNRSNVTVKPLLAGYGAKVWINGRRCSSRSIRLGTYGSSTPVTIRVLAQDGFTERIYTLHLIRNSPGG